MIHDCDYSISVQLIPNRSEKWLGNGMVSPEIWQN